MCTHEYYKILSVPEEHSERIYFPSPFQLRPGMILEVVDVNLFGQFRSVKTVFVLFNGESSPVSIKVSTYEKLGLEKLTDDEAFAHVALLRL